MHYADVDLRLASLGTNMRQNFFVMDFLAIRLNAHALNVVFSRRCCLCLHFDDVIPLTTPYLPAAPLTPKLRLLECGPMPNLMVALPNIGGALCSTPQSSADAHY